MAVTLHSLVTCELLQRSLRMWGHACSVCTAWCMMFAMHFGPDALKYERACQHVSMLGHPLI